MATKIDAALDSSNLGTSKVEEIAAKNIRNQLVKYVSPVLKSLRDPPDNVEEYKVLYGSLGVYLHTGVTRARQQSGNKTGQTPGVTTGVTTSVTPGAGAGQGKETVKLASPGVLLPTTPLTPGPPSGQGLQQQQQQNRVFLVSPQQQLQQGVRIAPGAQMSPGVMLPGQINQMMTPQQQQQQQMQRQFSQQQNPFQ